MNNNLSLHENLAVIENNAMTIIRLANLAHALSSNEEMNIQELACQIFNRCQVIKNSDLSFTQSTKITND